MTSGAWYDDNDEEESPISRRFCPWCGAQVLLGRPYCSSCGKEVSGASGPSALARLGNGIKKVGAWIGAALVSVVFLVVVLSAYVNELGFLKDAAALVTGGETETPDSECKGFSAWHEGSKERFERVQKLYEESETTTTYASAMALSDQIFALAREQERSNPPPAAIEYNRNMVALIDLSAKGMRGHANADYAELSQVTNQLDLLNQSSSGVEGATIERCG